MVKKRKAVKKKKRSVKKKRKPVKKSKKKSKITKLSAISKSELSKIDIDDLWIMKPKKRRRGRRRKPRVRDMRRARYCGCRDVCLV